MSVNTANAPNEDVNEASTSVEFPPLPSSAASHVTADETSLAAVAARDEAAEEAYVPPSSKGARQPQPDSRASSLAALQSLHGDSRQGGVRQYGPRDYIQAAQAMSAALPHLKCLADEPRNDRSALCRWYDYRSGTLLRPARFDQQRIAGSLRHDYRRDELACIKRKLREAIPLEADTRVIVVEDLTPEMIDLLGSLFDVPPEYFAEHLHNSGYMDGRYTEPDPDDWITAGMQKDYISLKWYRPVFRPPDAPSQTMKTQLLNSRMDGVRWTEQRLVRRSQNSTCTVKLQHQLRAFSNIIREGLEMAPDPNATVVPMAWAEKMTLWQRKFGECLIGE